MVLSRRLETIASSIPLHRNVIDIGCDHGLLDIYLAKTRKDIKVLGTDISPFSIASAEKKAAAFSLPNLLFEVRDGLKDFPLQEEVLVLSGMGAFTILDILKEASLNGNMLIISAHKNVDIVRKEIVKWGYYIEDEKDIFDKKWYCILTFQKGKKEYREEEYLIGPFAYKNIEYIEYLYQKEKKLAQKKGVVTPLLKALENAKRATQ